MMEERGSIISMCEYGKQTNKQTSKQITTRITTKMLKRVEKIDSHFRTKAYDVGVLSKTSSVSICFLHIFPETQNQIKS